MKSFSFAMKICHYIGFVLCLFLYQVRASSLSEDAKKITSMFGNSKQAYLGELYEACFNGDAGQVDVSLKKLKSSNSISIEQLEHCVSICQVLDDPAPIFRAITENFPNKLIMVDGRAEFSEEALMTLYIHLIDGSVDDRRRKKFIRKSVMVYNSKVLLFLRRHGVLTTDQKILHDLVNQSRPDLNFELTFWALEQDPGLFHDRLPLNAFLKQVESIKILPYLRHRIPGLLKRDSNILSLLEGGSWDVYQFLISKAAIFNFDDPKSLTKYLIAIISSRNPEAPKILEHFVIKSNFCSKMPVSIADILVENVKAYGDKITLHMLEMISTLFFNVEMFDFKIFYGKIPSESIDFRMIMSSNIGKFMQNTDAGAVLIYQMIREYRSVVDVAPLMQKYLSFKWLAIQRKN